MMQDPQRAIEQHIAQSIRHQRCGEYAPGYRCIVEAVRSMAEGGADDATRCRVLIEAARCSYYLTRFDESERYLEELRAVLPSTGEHAPWLSSAAAMVAANIHRRRGDFREALAELAARVPDRDDCPPSILVEKLLIEGSCRFYLSEVQVAEEKLEAALGLAVLHADRRLRSRVLTMMGFLARSKGQLLRAQDCLLRAADLCRAESDAYGEAAACLNLGIVRYQTGAFADAGRTISRALALFERIEWKLGVCRCLLALGNVKRYRRDFDAASDLYERARDLAEDGGFTRETALAGEYIGDLHRERRAYADAERCYREALAIARGMAPRGDIVVEVHRRLGELSLHREEFEQSIVILGRGYALARRLVERVEEALILRAMGAAFIAMGKRARGIRLFRKGIQLLSAIQARFELAISHLLLAEALLGITGDRTAVPDAGELRDGNEVEEAWRSLVEASHLLHGFDIPYWRSRVDSLVDAVTACRQEARAKGERFDVTSDHVEITFDPESVISGMFAGVSAKMLDVWRQVQFAAHAPWPVLITGETGTGKELVARTIHKLSERGDRPFIAVNCAAIPDHLFESEFFGHRRGCFTGAVLDRRGMLEEANGGTLFLDEIGELSSLQQAKLLRVLQESMVRRVGENIERAVDIRLISATNQDLDLKIAGDAFRKDFYYRINTEHIHIPPLRERPEDIVPLVGYFLGRDTNGKRMKVSIELSALRNMQRYSWPGNVRELFSVLERIRNISRDGIVSLDMLPERISSRRADTSRIDARREDTGGPCGSRLREILALCNGNKSAAAKRLGVSRGTLYKELRRTGLDHLIRVRPAS